MKKESRKGAIRESDLKKKSVLLFYYLMYLVMLIVCAIMLFPLLWVVLSSVKTYEEFIRIPPTIFPQTFDFQNIVDVWKRMKFYRYFLNSVVVTSGSVLSCLLFGGMLGYVLSKMKPKGSEVILKMLFFTMLIPGTTNLVPAYYTWVNFPIFGNLTNTYYPFWIGSAAGVYNIILFKNFFDTVPKSYIESATLDGCSRFGVFARIVVPISAPIFLTIGIFTFGGSWNDYLMPMLILKKDSLKTIGVALSGAKNMAGNKGILAVMYSIILPIIVFCVAQKYVLNNDAMTGIKE